VHYVLTDMGGIVVTGGAGFIGSHLVERLEELNKQVSIIDNFSTGKMLNFSNLHYKPFVTIYELGSNKWGELHDIIGLDTLIHLAAPVSVEESFSNPDKYHRQIVEGSAQLFDWAIRNGCKNIVVASTAAVYGETKTFPTTEDSKLSPGSPYASCKLELEELCMKYKANFSVLRFFNVFGERQANEGGYLSAIPIFYKQYGNRDNLTVTGDGQQTRDFVYVKDVVDAIIASIGYNGVWNVGSGEEVKIIDIAKAFSDNIEFIPARKEARRSLSDISKIKEDLGWSPQVSLINWIKSIKNEMG